MIKPQQPRLLFSDGCSTTFWCSLPEPTTIRLASVLAPPLHDPLAVAVVLSTLNPIFARQHPDQALKFDDKDGERFGITVVTDGLHGVDLAITGQLGRSVASPSERRGVAIPRGVDLEAFWTLILDCLQRADDWNAQRP